MGGGFFCEASDLSRLPPLSLDPIGEQVQSNTQALNSLSSPVADVEKKVTSRVDITRSISTFSTRDQAGEESAKKSTSYAQVVSTPSNTLPPCQSLPPKQLPQQPRDLNRESKVNP